MRGCRDGHHLRRLIGAKEQLPVFNERLGAGIAADGPGNRHIVRARDHGGKLSLLAGIAIHPQLAGRHRNLHTRYGALLIGIQLQFVNPNTSGPAGGVGFAHVELKDAGILRLKVVGCDVAGVAGDIRHQRPIAVIGQNCTALGKGFGQQVLNGNLRGI